MKKESNKSMTIEDLAEMIHKTMASKEDIKRVEQIQKNMFTELNATREDVRHLRNTVSSLVHGEAAQDTAIENLETRVHRLEKNVA